MRFLNELINRTKAAHVDVVFTDPAALREVPPAGDAEDGLAELDLPHLRQSTNFDHFASNRRTESDSDVVESDDTEEDFGDTGMSAEADHHTALFEDDDDAPDEFVIRRPDAGGLFARARQEQEDTGTGMPADAAEPERAVDAFAEEPGLTDQTTDDSETLADPWQEPMAEADAFEADAYEEDPFGPADDLGFPPLAGETEDNMPFGAPSPQSADAAELSDVPASPAEPIAAQRTESASRVNIWDIDGTGAEDEDASKIEPATPGFTEAGIADLSEAASQQRRSGRVRTRLLGFHRPDELPADPFDRAARQGAASCQPTFPVGWMVVEKGPGRGAFFPLFTGVSKIGRGEDQAVRLDFGDMSVSRDGHAVVAYDDEQRAFFIGHSGKSNPVRLNGIPVLSTEPFNDGDRIRIGETTLRFVALCGPDFDWEDETGAGDLYAAAR
ncbi:FHA domain-containing protein [Tropicimonas sp. IMCC6043]|uniref:FHA domain-containing protein n=1 Tax=Tropicimonas sp. IMCC6043 TaxID=2510645 RepID=UPI00101C65E8|nr:FHA domain-containing protein [Tropicimonas sp. IMCC6043]RYH11257.1 FHA domain-containing protein [Tropicimonas sp. IMCC6043]